MIRMFAATTIITLALAVPASAAAAPKDSGGVSRYLVQ